MRRSALALLFLPACTTYIGNGVPETEVRAVFGFSQVKNTTGLRVDLVSGDDDAVSVTCDENLLELILTRLESSGTLVIDQQEMTILQPEVDCVVDVIAIGVTAVENTGSGVMFADGPFPGFTSVVNSGSGALDIDGVAGVDLVFESSGSGELTVLGSAETVDVDNSGSGGITAQGVAAEDATVVNSGSGDVTVSASGLVIIDLSGSGDVDVFGGPSNVSVTDTGSGEVDVH